VSRSGDFRREDATCTMSILRPQVYRAKWVCADEAEAQEMDEDLDEDLESGQRKVKKLPDPKAPTADEKEEHEKTHLPYRSWCKHCIKGRGKQLPHCEGAQEATMCELHMDDSDLSREGEDDQDDHGSDDAEEADEQLHAEESGRLHERDRVPAWRLGREIGPGRSDQGVGRGRRPC
jgi:hypothetical protein